MATNTPNYGLIKPGVNDPTDQDLWGGMLNQDMDIIDSTMKAISNVADVAGQLPVGSLYFNADDGTNPGTLLGYGTWASFGQGRVILGAGTGTDINAHEETFTAGDTGGEYQHTQTTAEVGPHQHASQAWSQVGRTGGANCLADGTGNYSTSIAANQETATPMPWMQPYITVYIWRRTA